MAFQKGQGGRPRGALNKATRDAQEFCRSVVDDPMYQARLRRRAMNGTLAPAIECFVWCYAKGKPKDRVEIDRGMTPAKIFGSFTSTTLRLRVRRPTSAAGPDSSRKHTGAAKMCDLSPELRKLLRFEVGVASDPT